MKISPLTGDNVDVGFIYKSNMVLNRHTVSVLLSVHAIINIHLFSDT